MLAACDKLRGVFERDMHYYNFVHLLDLDLLERAIQQPYYIDYELSTAFGQEVRISRKQLKETLACIKKKVEKRSKYQVVITPMSASEPDDGRVVTPAQKRGDRRRRSARFCEGGALRPQARASEQPPQGGTWRVAARRPSSGARRD